MTINFEIYKNSVWQNINNHIDGCDPVPYISRNRDWSPNAEPMNCKISRICPYPPVEGDSIRVVIDTVPIFCGTVKTVKYNYENHYYEITSQPDLAKLDYKCTYENLHAAIINTSDLFEYNSNDGGFPTLNVMWLMKCMFSVAGLSLSTSDIDGVTFATWVTGQIPYNKLALDENMLYCAGLGVATNYDNAKNKHYDSVLSCLKITQELCAILGIGLIQTGIKSFKCVCEHTSYTIPNDNKPGYFTEKIFKENESAHIVVRAAAASMDTDGIRRAYKSDLETMLTSRVFGDSTDDILGWGNYIAPLGSKDAGWIDSLVIKPYAYTNGAWTPAITIFYSSTSTLPCDLNFTWELRNNKIALVKKDWLKETINCPIDLTPKTVLKNFINIEKRQSEIEQEAVI